ncbi:MAG: YceI family protein [Gammaproteobacteria bacterium]|nr:YceI family protein [Gammaproteobacteria bacterium]
MKFYHATLWLLLLSVGVISSGCTNLRALNADLAIVEYETGGLQYALDRETTEVKFRIGDTKGKFRVTDARLTFTTTQLSGVVLEVSIATASVDVFNPLLEQMLRGADWFAAKQFPLAKFKTTAITRNPADQITATGDLMIKGISLPLILDVTFDQGLPDLKTPPPNIEFSASGEFSRSAYAMSAFPTMAPDTVVLNITGSFVQQ